MLGKRFDTLCSILSKSEIISFISLLIFILITYYPAFYDTFPKVVGRNVNGECRAVGGNFNEKCQLVGGNFNGGVRYLEGTSMGSVR